MEGQPPAIEISPPLLNSANAWATSLEDLIALFKCPSTGAVTTRTSLLEGFGHDDAIHQFTFFDPVTHVAGVDALDETGSLNNLGYSPIPLRDYLTFIKIISDELTEPSKKLFIISVTGTPEEVAECYRLISEHSKLVSTPLAMEINLSCPNIPDKPPPAYSGDSLSQYLNALEKRVDNDNDTPRVPYGLKTPPYTYAGQFETLMSALLPRPGTPSPVSFLTATNTLGSCLVLRSPDKGAAAAKLAGSGVGGMAGAPLHPLALGNVAALRRLLDREPETRHVSIVGIGGVEDAAGYRRMRGVGAAAVGVGTALGRKGVGVFGEIERGVEGVW